MYIFEPKELLDILNDNSGRNVVFKRELLKKHPSLDESFYHITLSLVPMYRLSSKRVKIDLTKHKKRVKNILKDTILEGLKIKNMKIDYDKKRVEFDMKPSEIIPKGNKRTMKEAWDGYMWMGEDNIIKKGTETEENVKLTIKLISAKKLVK